MQGLVQREEMAMNHLLSHEADRFPPPARRSMWISVVREEKCHRSSRRMALLDSCSTLGFCDSGLSL